MKNKLSFIVPVNEKSTSIIQKAIQEEGLKIEESTSIPMDATILKSLRVGLWDRYGGSMSSGWLRWILEKHHFDFSLIYAKEINEGNLNTKYDAIVFVEGAIPAMTAEAPSPYEEKEPSLEEIPAEFHKMVGKITAEKSIPAIKNFIENGGKVITIGSSANLAYHLKLPVKNALTEVVSGKEKPLPGEKFYIPGSVMQMTVATNYEANWGMKEKTDVYFNMSPVFKLQADAIANGQVTPLGWYSNATTLRSGWAFGQSYLQDGVAAFKANIGKGNLFVFGPEITFRGQTHSAYKMLFNQLFQSNPLVEIIH